MMHHFGNLNIKNIPIGYNFFMNIAIIGANGQLGNFLLRKISGAHGFTRQNINLLNAWDVKQKLSNFDVIINCAAYTDTKKAEIDKQNFDVNYKAVKNISKACKGKLLVHISTQWVFSPSNFENKEYDFLTEKPLTKYGLAKWKADKYLTKHNKNHLIIRPGWLHSSGKQNFITKMNSFNKREYSIVTDDISQITTGSMILEVIQRALEDEKMRGIIQVASKEHVSRFDLFEKYCKFSNKSVKLHKIKSMDINVDLSKTNYQFMDISKYESNFKIKSIDSIIKNWIKEEEWKQ